MNETLRSWAWTALAIMALLRAPNNVARFLGTDAGLFLLLLGYAELSDVQPDELLPSERVADAA